MTEPFYIMAKPVCGTCNLDCTYCYYKDKPRELYPGVQKFMMAEDVLESYTRQYIAAQPELVNFGWQGGEPLLAGLEFFRRAVALQKQFAGPTQKIANAVQTNGTLLDDAWCEFLAENKVLVGLSLDGPEEWHDAFRRDHAGHSSFGRAWAGLELLRKYRVEFNVLVTLNRRNAPHVGDIYRYFVNRGILWLQFIPVLEKDAAGRPMDFSCTSEQFGRFMLEVFELWRQRHVGVVSERLIDSVLHTLVHGQSAMCCNAPRCANAHVLEWNGDLYACDHFVYAHWNLGNIMQTPLSELLRAPRLQEFGLLKTRLPDACKACEYVELCQGGCPKHHIPSPETGDPNRVNHFCEGYMMFFREALPELRRMAEYLRRGQRPPLDEWAGRKKPAAARPPAEAARAPAAAPSAAPSRNALCPCGSGRKFKQCCGR